jgi:hypothetical protein
VVLAAAGLLVIVLARNWRRAGRSALAWEFTDQADFEISAPGSGWLARVRQRLFRLRPERRPVTAEAAYLATLKELEPLPFHRRLDVETPAGHARRLHVEGSGTLELDLLAANYQLSRWGRRHLPERETRRAIGRWERSRVRIAGWLAAEHAQQVHAEGSKPADQP